MTTNRFNIPHLDEEELIKLEEITRDFSPGRLEKYLEIYKKERKKASIGQLLGIVSVATGLHGLMRFYYRETGIGIVYFFTGGFCLIGTILDLIKNHQLANECNLEIMERCILLSLGTYPPQS